MPIVIPLPLGGLGASLNELDENLLAIEAARLGTAFDFPTITTLPQTFSTWTQPTGWPSVTASIASGGAALYVSGFMISNGRLSTGVQIAVSIDGAAPVISSISTDLPQIIWYQPLSMGAHTFTTVLKGTLTETLTNPYLAVLPV